MSKKLNVQGIDKEMDELSNMTLFKATQPENNEEPTTNSDTEISPKTASETVTTPPSDQIPERPLNKPQISSRRSQKQDKKLKPRVVQPMEINVPNTGSLDFKEGTYGTPYARTPARRTITRYAFEFYQDQIEKLRNFSLQEKLQGDKGSMSEMVREAIDDYIEKRKETVG